MVVIGEWGWEEGEGEKRGKNERKEVHWEWERANEEGVFGGMVEKEEGAA